MRGLRKGKKYEAGRGASSLNSHAPNEEQADRPGPGVCHLYGAAPHGKWHGPTLSTPPGPHPTFWPLPIRHLLQTPSLNPSTLDQMEPRWVVGGLVSRQKAHRFFEGIRSHATQNLISSFSVCAGTLGSLSYSVIRMGSPTAPGSSGARQQALSSSKPLH
jgi:hypothetical protein